MRLSFCSLIVMLTTLLPSGELMAGGIELVSLETKKAVSTTEIHQKPRLVVFFASWCKGCSENMAMVKEAFDPTKLEDKVRAVTVDEDLKAAYSYFDGKPHLIVFKKLSYLDKGGSYASKLKLNSLPAVVLLDAKGQVAGKIEGVMDQKQKDSLLKQFNEMVK